MIKVFGLKNCDTCRAAMKWLAGEGIDAHLHDVRKDGLTPQDLDLWLDAVGWDVLLNKRGTTWRGLDEPTKSNITQESARSLMLAHPALIKRPIFTKDDNVVVGFKEPQKTTIFGWL